MEIVDEEKQVEKSIEERTKEKERVLRISGTVFSLIVLIILIIIKVNKPSFPLFWFVGAIVLIIVFFLSMWFGFSLYRKYQDALAKKSLEGKLPPAVTFEQARLLIRKLLAQPQYSDYEVGWHTHRVFNVGETIKSRVLLVRLSPTPYSSDPFQFIIMNLHYPTEMWDYVTQTKYNPGELSRLINSLGVDPKVDPDVERRIERDLSSGKETEYIKKSKHDKEEPKKEKKEDLE